MTLDDMTLDEQIREVMTEWADRELRKCYREQDKDIEKAHEHADDVLCILLGILGYSDIVGMWQVVKKYYA